MEDTGITAPRGTQEAETFSYVPAVTLTVKVCRIEINNHADKDTIQNTLLALQQLCQGTVRGTRNQSLVTDRTNMSKSFEGLTAIIQEMHQMDPFANAVHPFCGQKLNTLKALYFGKGGSVLL